MKFHPRRTIRVLLPALTAGLALTALPAQAASTLTNGGSSDANAGNWINVDDLTFTSGTTGTTVHGADISSLAKSEAKGGVYKTS
ncbi:hypothetical protein GCM10010345_31580 [Streptomyces canarius]|uniref:Pectate lyase n=1 Tax=Streptomyces canarius TaxID=285453 RepID=A0ABQ3CPF9_9ACTN|nr:hypothetical protein GCM10010345_31580 [Streptomyces canarius]